MGYPYAKWHVSHSKIVGEMKGRSLKLKIYFFSNWGVRVGGLLGLEVVFYGLSFGPIPIVTGHYLKENHVVLLFFTFFKNIFFHATWS